MNQVCLLGRLVKDIELRYTNSNTAYCKFTLAVNRRFKQEGQPTADFISCMAWGKTAEFCSKHFAKGSQMAIEGRIQTGNYEKDGQKVYTTDVIVEGVYFAGEKKVPSNAGDSWEPTDDEITEGLPF